MTAKQVLRQVSLLDHRIRQDRQELERIKKDIYGMNGLRYDREAVQTSPEDRMPDMITEMVEAEEKLRQEINQFIMIRADIIQKIRNIGYGDYEVLLYERYINRKSLNQIAFILHVSYPTVKRYHTKALKRFAELYIEPS